MKSFSKRSMATFVFAAVVLTLTGAALWWNSADKLGDVHAGITASYPSVAHVTPDEFSQLDKASLLIIDTRERPEFEVSHLPGAIQISPDLSAEGFLAQYGGQVAGKTVVFYCSVGVRSSQFIEKVQSSLKARGATTVANLEEGLFGWHNEKRALVTGNKGETEFIHPYDEIWGRLIERGQLTSYTP